MSQKDVLLAKNVLKIQIISQTTVVIVQYLMLDYISRLNNSDV